MYKRIIIFVLYILTSFCPLFSTYVNLNIENHFSTVDLAFYDNSKKISIKIKDNKIEELNSLEFKYKSIEIKKFDLFKNRNLSLKTNDIYYIKYSFPKLSFYKSYRPLFKSEFEISSFILRQKYFLLQSMFYYKYFEENIGYYYDYSNLNFTKKGLINYIDYGFNDFKINSEFSISNYGFYYSLNVNYQYKYLDLYFCSKNINEKFNYGLIFDYKPISFEVNEKIYPISIYGGQGKKREYFIESDILLNSKTFKTNLHLYHEVKYNEFLKKEVKNIISINEKIKVKNNYIEALLSYSDNFSISIIMNKFKIRYYKKILFFDINYITRDKTKSFNINFSSKGEINILYTFNV